MNEIVTNAIVVVMVIICVAAGIWAWRIENGPEPKNKKENNEASDGTSLSEEGEKK